MKLLAHFIAIVIGLIVGLTVRASMQRDATESTSQEEPISILSNASRSGSSGVTDILSLIEDGPLTASQEARLQVALLDLPEKQFPSMVQQLLVNWQDNKPALDALLSAWGEVAPREALAMIAQMPRLYRNRAKNYVMDAWVLTDADAAFAHVNQGPRKHAPFISLTKDAPLWDALTQADPREALARAERIDDVDERRQREDQIVGRLSHQDPQFALNWLEENRDGAAQKKALPGVLRGWVATEPHKAFEYLVSLDEAAQTREAFESFSQGLTLELAEEFRDSVPDNYRNTFWGSYVERHAQMNPAEAAALVESLPEGWSRQRALEGIATQWSFVDLEATSEWVSTLSRSRSRDLAISAFAHQLMATDPEAGVSWFADMDTPGDRAPHLNNALIRWLRQDHAAASEWMDAQSNEILPDEMKAKVLEAVPR